MQAKPIWRYAVFHYVVLLSVGLWLTRFLHFALLERLTVFFLPLVWLTLLLFTLGGIIWSSVFWRHSAQVGNLSDPVDRRWLPLLLQCAGVILALTIPFEQLWLRWNFQQQLDTRAQVIRLVRENQIPATADTTALPIAYRQSSMSGDIQTIRRQNELYVLFFTLRTIGAAQGFVYSEQTGPLPTDLFPGYQVRHQRPIKPHWHYVTIGDGT